MPAPSFTEVEDAGRGAAARPLKAMSGRRIVRYSTGSGAFDAESGLRVGPCEAARPSPAAHLAALLIVKAVGAPAEASGAFPEEPGSGRLMGLAAPGGVAVGSRWPA